MLIEISTGGEDMFTMLLKSIIRKSHSKIEQKLLAAEDIKYTV